MVTPGFTGFIDDLPAHEYHAASWALGSTSLKRLATQPPAVWKWESENPSRPSAPLVLGTAAHSLILEDDTPGLSIVNAEDWRSKTAREAREAAYAEGTVPLLAKEFAVVEAMREAVMAHPHAARLLTGHVAERSYFAEIDGVPVKARLDALKGSTVVDLKTTSADLGSIERTVASFGYHVQQAHYTDVIEACGQPVDDFVFIFVSTAAPHLVRVVRLEECAVDLGREQARHALAVWKHCTETDTWPGYTGIDTLDLPAWVYAEQDNDIIKEIVI